MIYLAQRQTKRICHGYCEKECAWWGLWRGGRKNLKEKVQKGERKKQVKR